MRVGIVGLGFRLAYLVRVFSAVLRDFTVAGYVDPDPAGLPQLIKEGLSVGTRHASLDDLLAKEDFDVLMVGSPNHFHLGHIRAGLEHGKKVFAEKPVVTTIDDTIELARLLGHYGHENVMVGLVLRYAPLYVDLQKALADGLLGEVVSIEASEHIAPYHGAFFMRDWRRYEKYSGSFMLEKCCHDLDLYNGVTKSRARRVASFGGRKSFIPANAPEGAGVNDTAIYHVKPSGWLGSDKVFDSDGDIIDFQTAIVEYESGAAMAFHTNINVPDQFRRFCVVGSKGMAEGDFFRNFFRVHDARTSAKLIDKSYQHSELSEHYGADEQMARDVQAHLERGITLPVSVIEALEAGLLALCLDEARRSHSVVDMLPIWEKFDVALSARGRAGEVAGSTA
jgi:predicted dehydrogenase